MISLRRRAESLDVESYISTLLWAALRKSTSVWIPMISVIRTQLVFGDIRQIGK